jgi:acetolactate synthase-1/3 small subunit
MEEKKLYTITITCENVRGILNQITIIFTRRAINIESSFAFPDADEDLHRIVITAISDKESIEKVVRQIEKRIGILSVSYRETVKGQAQWSPQQLNS